MGGSHLSLAALLSYKGALRPRRRFRNLVHFATRIPPKHPPLEHIHKQPNEWHCLSRRIRQGTPQRSTAAPSGQGAIDRLSHILCAHPLARPSPASVSSPPRRPRNHQI